MSTQDHMSFLLPTWRSTGEWIRKASTTVNAMIDGGPFPRRWSNLTESGSAAKLRGVSDPTWTQFRNQTYAYAFAYNAGTENEFFLSFTLNHDYSPGTQLYPGIHWSTINTLTGTVRWKTELTYANSHGDGTFGTTTILNINQATDGVAYTHYYAEFNSGIPGTGLEPDALILMRVFRDNNDSEDTLNGDAYCLAVTMHYEADRRGGTINRAPDFYES